MSNTPEIAQVIEENGEISDDLDYALMRYLMENRGSGFTACQPKLVKLKNGTKAIKMGIDNTFVGKDNQLMGLGIVGKLFIDAETLEVIYATPLEQLEQNIEKLKEAGIKPQPRPKGKY